MGYDLFAYIQIKDKDKWKMLPLKYEDNYVEIHWCGWDCAMADIIKTDNGSFATSIRRST